MKNITLSADEHLIDEYDATIASLRGKLQVGRKLTRDEMNAR